HADAFAQGDDFEERVVDAVAGDEDVALVRHAVHQVVHAGEVSQEGGSAASGRADEGGGLALGALKAEDVQHLGRTVAEAGVLARDVGRIEPVGVGRGGGGGGVGRLGGEGGFLRGRGAQGGDGGRAAGGREGAV